MTISEKKIEEIVSELLEMGMNAEPEDAERLADRTGITGEGGLVDALEEALKLPDLQSEVLAARVDMGDESLAMEIESQIVEIETNIRAQLSQWRGK